LKTVAIVGARLNSSRLPRKHLLDLAGQALIQRVVTRLETCENIDTIVLATTNDKFNKDLIDWANNNITCYAYTGDVNNLLGRVDYVVKKEQASYVIYICGDCPLIEPKYIDHALSSLKKYSSYDKVNLHPNIKSLHEGVDIYTRSGWDTLVTNSQSEMAKEHIGFGHKESPCLRTLYIKDCYDFTRVHHRLSVDTTADYNFMKIIYQRWFSENASETIVDLAWVQQQILKDKLLVVTNSHVTQKQADRHYARISLYCHASKLIGLGNLKRCSLMAQSLQENLGYGTTIHVHGTPFECNWLDQINVVWYEDIENLYDNINQKNSGLFIVDFNPDHLDSHTLVSKIKTANKNDDIKIIAIDRLTCLLDYCDVLLIPSFHSKLDHPKINIGWKNYFFDKPLYVDPPIKNQVCILTGGSDALGYGKHLADILEQSVPSDYRIVWVQGPYADKPILNKNSRISILYNNRNLQSIISESKIIVSTYGLSFFESLASGNITLLLPSQEILNEDEYNALEHHKCCLLSADIVTFKRNLASVFNDALNLEPIKNKARSLLNEADGCKILCEITEGLLNQKRYVNTEKSIIPS
jgi:spore coat polysaccharide biosynthesis protein SpsF (cytidylyltransferase family)/spore coat polysaccharide biosynthesis predicted glycosyltransferase SpsG